MGNCWRMPEDHSGLLHLPPPHFPNLPNSSSAIPSSTSTSYLTFTPSNLNSFDTSAPKLVTLNHAFVDANAIKAAQCRNLVDHMPLISYNETTVKQTECDICLIDFMPDEQVRQLPCEGAHIFHPLCIDQWLEKSLTCPHCSTNVDAALLLKFIPRSNNNDDDDDW